MIIELVGNFKVSTFPVSKDSTNEQILECIVTNSELITSVSDHVSMWSYWFSTLFLSYDNVIKNLNPIYRTVYQLVNKSHTTSMRKY